MKKFLIILFVIASIAKQSCAQTNVYHPFPDSNAVWYGDCVNVPYPPPYPPSYSYYQYNINGSDTIIGTKSYIKLLDNYGNLVGAYRNDTTHRKVFGFQNPPPFIIENLLYDFSLAVGDTFTARMITYCDTIAIVTSIDSILIGSQYRKQINLVSPMAVSVSIIEGIGSIGGLFSIRTCGETWCDLCFFQDAHGTYGTSPCLTGIKEPKNNFSFSLSPNPSSGIFTLTSSEKISSVEITDVLGSVIKKFHASTSPSTPLGMTFDLSSQPKGIYFLKAEDEKGNFRVRKVVLQ